MIPFHKIWVEQCEAARGVQDSFGTPKALGYLIGEKFVNFLRASETRPEFAAEIPAFVSEIRGIFEPYALREYLGGLRRIGPMGHITTDEEFEIMRKAGVFVEDPVRGAEDVLIVERIKELLLG
jgi:hypothetical protein